MVDVIKPSIGRKVWYIPDLNDTQMYRMSSQPFDATIVHVHSNTSINVLVADHHGFTFRRRCAINIDVINGEAHCVWMPYQVEQAKKHETEAGKVTQEGLDKLHEVATEKGPI